MAYENLRKLVWEGLLDADYASLYYGYLAKRLETKERILSLVLTLLTSGAFLTLFLELPIPKAPELLALAAAGVSLFLTFEKYSKAAMLSASFHKKWSKQEVEYEILWHQLEELDPQAALDWWKRLRTRDADIAEFATVEFSVNERLRERCQEEVLRARGLPRAA